MGFLIFAYRKLFLTRKMNDLSFKSMLLSQKKQQITSQIAQVQENISNAKTMTNMMGSIASSGINNSVMSEYYEKDPKGSMVLKKEFTDKGLNANTIQAQITQDINTRQQAIMFTNAACGSIFDAVDKTQLAALNAEDTHIEMQIKNIESQSIQLKPELESVEKAEADAAKSSAPKFGLA